MTFIGVKMIDLEPRAWSKWAVWFAQFLPMALVSGVIVRWAFAVPLAVLQDLPFGVAMRASDGLSDNRTFPLWSLVMESEITGYIALIAPNYILFYLHLPQTVFTYYAALAAALFLSAMTQAPLMIGLGLVLAKNNEDKGGDTLSE